MGVQPIRMAGGASWGRGSGDPWWCSSVGGPVEIVLVRVIARAFSAGFQLVVRCVRLLLVGSSERVMGYIHMIVVVLIGECPCVWAAWR